MLRGIGEQDAGDQNHRTGPAITDSFTYLHDPRDENSGHDDAQHGGPGSGRGRAALVARPVRQATAGAIPEATVRIRPAAGAVPLVGAARHADRAPVDTRSTPAATPAATPAPASAASRGGHAGVAWAAEL